MSKQEIEELQINIDKELFNALKRNKKVMADYHYGMIVLTQKILKKKCKLPAVTAFRKFCNELRKVEYSKNVLSYVQKCSNCGKRKKGTFCDTPNKDHFGEVIEIYLCFDCLKKMEEK